MSKNKIWALLIFSTLLSYGISLKYGFSQDDWFHLSISRATTFAQFLNFFNPMHVSWIFFRPISTQLPYWISSSIFSLSYSAYFMHFMMLIIHCLNGYLVVQIGKKYLNSQLSLLLGVLYTISNIHFLSLFYIGAIQQLISTLFSLLAILLVLKKSRANLTLALLVILALLSKELSLRLPVILFIIAYYQERNILKSVKRVAPAVIVASLYFGMRYLVGSVSASEYELSFSPSTTIATIMWYFLFLIGFPEEILQYGLSKGMVDFAGFFANQLILKIFILLSAIPLLYFSLKKIVNLYSSKNKLDYIYFPILSIVSLAPIIFLPTHRYPHYLDLAFVFMGIWLLSQFKQLTTKGLIIASIVALGMVGSIWVDIKTHWTIKRSLESSRQINNLQQSGACNSSEGVIFRGTAEEIRDLSYALSIENGPRVICQNPSLKVQYLISP